MRRVDKVKNKRMKNIDYIEILNKDRLRVVFKNNAEVILEAHSMDFGYEAGIYILETEETPKEEKIARETTPMRYCTESDTLRDRGFQVESTFTKPVELEENKVIPLDMVLRCQGYHISQSEKVLYLKDRSLNVLGVPTTVLNFFEANSLFKTEGDFQIAIYNGKSGVYTKYKAFVLEEDINKIVGVYTNTNFINATFCHN